MTGAVARQSLDEDPPRLGMHEPITVEGTDLTVVDLRWEAEHQLEVRVGAEGDSLAPERKRAEIDALVCGLEQLGERGVRIGGKRVSDGAGRHRRL